MIGGRAELFTIELVLKKENVTRKWHNFLKYTSFVDDNLNVNKCSTVYKGGGDKTHGSGIIDENCFSSNVSRGDH